MVWSDLTYDDETNHPRGQPKPADQVVFDQALFDFYRSVTRLRHQHSALRRGELRFLLSDDKRRLLGFERRDDREKLWVFINRSEQVQVASVPRDPTRKSTVSPELLLATCDDQISIGKHADASQPVITLPPLCGVVVRF